MEDLFKSPQSIAAIVALITSLITLLLTLLTKNFIEKNLLIFKLDTEHKFEQRKYIKNALASNKSHLLSACESLNHRLLNFSKSDNYKWMEVKEKYDNPKMYYFHSFIYRVLVVHAWIKKTQNELIHLDTTIASNEDLDFIKFLKFYGRFFQDTDFFKNCEYNFNSQTDHIFRNNFDELYQVVSKDNKVISFNEYLENLPKIQNDKLVILYRLFDGVNADEDRLRWEWFQLLKMFNMAFLNAYGYDYQQTSDEKMLLAIKTPRKSKLNANFICELKEHKLNNHKQINRLIKLLNKK